MCYESVLGSRVYSKPFYKCCEPRIVGSYIVQELGLLEETWPVLAALKGTVPKLNLKTHLKSV
jgi:hypothetical protein